MVRHTEPDMAIVMCFEPTNADCAILPYCVLRKALDHARTAFVKALDDYTLSDLVKPRASLQSMLSIESAQPGRASIEKRRRQSRDRDERLKCITNTASGSYARSIYKPQPVTAMTWPVMPAAVGDARKTTASATSSRLVQRFTSFGFIAAMFDAYLRVLARRH